MNNNECTTGKLIAINNKLHFIQTYMTRQIETELRNSLCKSHNVTLVLCKSKTLTKRKHHRSIDMPRKSIYYVGNSR